MLEYAINHNLLTLINKVDKISAQLQTPSIATKPDDGSQSKITATTADYVSKQTIDNIHSLIMKSHDKINNLHTKDDEKNSIKIITALIEKIVKDDSRLCNDNGMLNYSKINEWPMQFENTNKTINETIGRPSLIVQQSIDDDILSIIKNTESRTWDALDSIFKKLIEQNDKIDSLLNSGNIDSSIGVLCNNEPLKSPLLESVNTLNHESLNAEFIVDSATEIHPVHDQRASDPFLPENSGVMGKLIQEAMTQSNKNNNNNVPETSRILKQKRLSPNPSDARLRIGDNVISLNYAEHSDKNTDNDVQRLNETDFLPNSLLTGELCGGPTNPAPGISSKQEFHLSHLAKTTTVQMVSDYLRAKNVQDNAVKIHQLIPHNKDINT